MPNWILIEKICKYIVWIFLFVLIGQLFLPPIKLPIFGSFETLLVIALNLVGTFGLFARYKNTGKMFLNPRRSLIRISVWLLIIALYFFISKHVDFQNVYSLLKD